jgi:hypothetical protein
VKPLLTAIDATPRVIKRYQNRMRYLAARLRPPVQEPDAFDRLLHWVGARLGRPLVPAVWFEVRPRPAIEEPALILLGAIELFAPKAFANPAELFTTLVQAMTGDERSQLRATAWSMVRDAFEREGLAMPTAAEVARYAEFVISRERPLILQAEVLRFRRDPAPGPRSV